jgi:hypothetical protein
VFLPFLKIRMAPAIKTPLTKIAQRGKAPPAFSWEICGVGLEGGAGLGDGVVVGVGLCAGVLDGVDIVVVVGTAVAVGVDEALNVAVALGVGAGCVGVGVSVAKATTAIQDGSSSVRQSSVQLSTIRLGKLQAWFKLTATKVSHAGEVGPFL